ncbi:MAG: hypothetical protein WDM94_02855 [Bauldia sp.]
MKTTEREALKRLIEYARLEAETQHESFAAYLLALATRALDNPMHAESGAEQSLGRMQ